VYLAGTELPARERLSVIERAIASSEPELERLAIEALAGVFKASHFTRWGGVEAQGSGFTREEWRPRTWEEIWLYWRDAMRMLGPYLVQEGDLGNLVRAKLPGQVRGMVRWGGFPIIKEAISLVDHAGIEWPEMLDGLRMALNYDSEELPEDVVDGLKELSAEIAPSEIGARLRNTISTPTWNELRKEEDGSITLVSEERAEALALEMAAQLDDLRPHLASLLLGEQRQGFLFGRVLGEHLSDPMNLVLEGLELLRQIPGDQRNSTVLMGLCRVAASIDKDGVRAALHPLLDDDDVRSIAADMIRATKADDVDIKALAGQIEEGKLDARSVASLALGRSLEPVGLNAISRLLRACLYADDEGPAVALDLLGMRVHREAIPDGLAGVTREVLVRVAEPGRASGNIVMLDHHYGELTTKILGRDDNPDEFIRTLMRAQMARTTEHFGAHDGIPQIVAALLQKHPDIAWPEFISVFSADDWSGAHRLQLSLGGLGGGDLDLPTVVGEERLLSWCERDDRAQYWVAKMAAPLGSPEEDSDYPSWSAFAITLLERYGSNKAVRSALSENVNSGFWAGSMVPLLSGHREAFVELKRHSNKDVAAWASNEVAVLDGEIEREKKRDEESEFGILR